MSLQFLGMTPARRRIEEAGIRAQREMAERAAAKLAKDRTDEAERVKRAAEYQTAPWVARQIERYAGTETTMSAAAVLAKPSWRTITAEVIAAHGFTDAEWRSLRSRRTKAVVLCRQELSHRLSRDLGMSLPEIGRVLGNFDHTTVLHGIRRHEARIAEAAGAQDPFPGSPA